MPTFYDVITEAVKDITENGYDSRARVQNWMRKIRAAANKALPSEKKVKDSVRRSLQTTFKKLVEDEQLLKRHPGVSKFTLQKIKPSLHAELERRIAASADLIKMNREAAIEKTMQRFSGWCVSVPPGGTKAADKPKVKKDVKKALSTLPFEERRVLIDQGHKLNATLSEMVAANAGAIAGKWHSHYKQAGYKFRPDHKDRDDRVYAIRNTWAQQKGLITKGAGYTDEMTQPGEEPMCRCYMEYIYAIRDMPDKMMTPKGKAELERVRALMRG